jgi:murein DD-endopeptidase MepM/ murein hydrolase activator NlpD
VRPLFTTALAVVCAVTPGYSTGTARADDAGGRDALALAWSRLDEARADAEQLSARRSDALARRAGLEAAIASAEHEVPGLRLRAERLAEAIRARAVRLYVGHATRIDTVFTTENVADGARAAQLTGLVAEHEAVLAEEMRATASELERRRGELEREREELQRTIAELAPLQERLDDRVQEATAAYDRVKDATGRITDAGVPVATTSGATRCPVAGFVVFTDDFDQPRPGGVSHQGIDMSATTDTPVVAVVSGLVRHDVGGAGGNGAWLSGSDDVSYYYAHFSRYEGVDRVVAAGEVIGYVGSTGNATGPHLHFEMHPRAGAAVDPYPFLLTLCAEETGDDVG